MRTCKLLLLAIPSLVLLSCTKESREGDVLMVKHTLTAVIGDITKAQIDGSDAEYRRVLWDSNEHVDVWANGTPYEFISRNPSEPAASVTFEGNAPADLGTWVLVSPKDASTSKSDGTVSASLPCNQTGVAGGFDRSAAIITGLGNGTSVECKHVFSGIRFKTGREGVTMVTLKGNNNEMIAGNFTFSFSEVTPVPGSGTEKVITLTAPGGGTFEADKWYYILCLPTTFSSGITLTAYVGSLVGTLNIPTADLVFSRGKIKSIDGTLDSRVSWNTPSTTTCYGPSNTFCLAPNASTNVDVSPRRILSGWIRSGETFAGAPEADACSILWNTCNVEASLEGNTLSINAGDSEGKALVAITKNGTILWSFLVWVSNSGPAESSLGGQLYFQWGRKDPLVVLETDRLDEYSDYVSQGCTPAKYPEGADNALLYSIENPTKFIIGGENTSDWFTDSSDKHDDSLWGGASGSKTVWDPCPDGWRVPSKTQIGALGITDEWGYLNYQAGGTVVYLYENGTSYLWTREGESDVSDYRYVTDNTYYSKVYRDTAMPVRCVRE